MQQGFPRLLSTCAGLALAETFRSSSRRGGSCMKRYRNDPHLANCEMAGPLHQVQGAHQNPEERVVLLTPPRGKVALGGVRPKQAARDFECRGDGRRNIGLPIKVAQANPKPTCQRGGCGRNELPPYLPTND